MIAGRGRGPRDRVRGLGLGGPSVTVRVPVLGLRDTGPARRVTADYLRLPGRVRRRARASERASSEQGGRHPPAPDRKTRSRHGPELPQGPRRANLGDGFQRGARLQSPRESPEALERGGVCGWSLWRHGPGPPSEPGQVWGSRGHCHQGSSPSVPPLQSTQGASPGTGSPEWAALVVGVEGGCVAPVLYGLGLGRSLR